MVQTDGQSYMEWRTCKLNSKDPEIGDAGNKTLSRLYLLSFQIEAAKTFSGKVKNVTK